MPDVLLFGFSRGYFRCHYGHVQFPNASAGMKTGLRPGQNDNAVTSLRLSVCVSQREAESRNVRSMPITPALTPRSGEVSRSWGEETTREECQESYVETRKARSEKGSTNQNDDSEEMSYGSLQL